MFETVIFFGGAGCGALAMALFSASKLSRVLDERDDAVSNLSAEYGVTASLENRVTVLRGDNEALQAEVKRLGSENVELQREAGRYAAEIRAANQRLAKFERARGAKGKFVAKDPGKKKPAPIACA